MSELAWERFHLGELARPGGARPASQPQAAAEASSRAQEQAGWRAGYQAGEAQAREEAKRIAALGASFARALQEAEAQLAERLLDLAIELARGMLKSDASLRREGLLELVGEAMRALPEGASRLQLRLHPADAAVVRARLGEELAKDGWSVLEDPRLEPGGCRVSAANCEIDATLATRWRQLLATLGKAVPWDG
jgi:flagellar assembly protein FliH